MGSCQRKQTWAVSQITKSKFLTQRSQALKGHSDTLSLVKLKNTGDKLRGGKCNRSFTAVLTSELLFLSVCHLHSLSAEKKKEIIQPIAWYVTFTSDYSFYQKQSLSLIRVCSQSAIEISLFPTRVLCFWDIVQQLDMWIAFTLGIPVFACICTQANFGKANTCIRTRNNKKKSWFKTPLYTL